MSALQTPFSDTPSPKANIEPIGVADNSTGPVAREAGISDIEPVGRVGDDSQAIDGTVADTIIDASSSMFDAEARRVEMAFEKKR